VNNGFSWETDGDLYDRAIHLYIEMIDSDDAVYATVIDKNFENYLDNGNIVFDNENIQIILNTISNNKIGYVEIMLNNEKQTFYFQAIPLNNTEYWVLVGVNRNSVIERLNINKIKIPIFIIGLLFIINAMDSIWQRIVKIRR
jgi:hypothetical protein